MGWLVTAIAAGLIMAKLWSSCEMSPYKSSVITKRNQDEDIDQAAATFTRGQIHYLSMDAGMSSCWNDTVKKLFGLACPKLVNGGHPELEVELAYILTSCFCMSIGAAPLHCRSQSPRDNDEYYHFSLIECATEKCFNKYDMDGFEINHRRIKDVCHYILAETKSELKEPIPYIDDKELAALDKVVSGDHFQHFDTKLHLLLDIVTQEIKTRQEGIMYWISQQFESFWLIVDDIKFKLRIGTYADIPYY